MKYLLVLVFLISVFTLSADWTIIQSFPIPESASGLAWDGEYLYTGIYGADGDQVYQIDPADGTYNFLCSGPQEDAFGLTFDGEYFWTTDHPGSSSSPAVAYQFDQTGSLMSQFNLPDHYMSGIAYDDGDFWVSTYYDSDGYIYKLDSTGTILDGFTAPDNQPWDLCLENEYLWMADYWGDAIYKIDPTDGAMLESHPSEGEDPAGVVFDGQYLWYIDAGSDYDVDYLYKIDLGGAGNPIISIDQTEHNFGNVEVGSSSSWTINISNLGTAPLEITAINFTDNSYMVDLTLPYTISIGETESFDIMFTPDEWGLFESDIYIESNDPVNPQEILYVLGYGLNPEQEIESYPNSLDFGSVRIGATTGQFISIHNQGMQSLIIDNIASQNTSFVIDTTVELPITIIPRDTVDIRIWFQPEDESYVTDQLTINSNDSNEPTLNIDLSGSGYTQDWPIGSVIWDYQITTGYDNSPKAILAIDDANNDGFIDVAVCSEDDYLRMFNSASDDMADIIWEVDMGSGYVYSQKGLITGFDIDDDGIKDVVIGTSGGFKVIRAFSGADGEILWTFNTNTYGTGGWVYQVDWRYDHNGDLFPDVVAGAGDDATDTGPKRIFCLDGLSGDLIWDYYVGCPVFSVISISDINDDGIADVLAGASDAYETTGKVMAFDGNNGNLIWNFDTPGSSVWALAQVDDIDDDGIMDVAAGDFSGNYYGFNATNGSILWSGSIGGFTLITRFQTMNDLNDNGSIDILVEHSGSSAYTIDGLTGANIWNEYLGDNSLSVAVIPDINGDEINDAVIGCLNNNAYFLDGTNGDILDSVTMPSAVDAIGVIPDVIGDDSWEMIAGSRDGIVACISGGVDVIVDAEDVLIPEYADIVSHGNWPNPFNSSRSLRSPATEICFSLKSSSDVEITIFNLKGQQIKKINIADMSEGFHQVSWDGADDENNPVGSGIYLYRISSANSSVVNKMVKMR